jgi:hypothetical protein
MAVGTGQLFPAFGSIDASSMRETIGPTNTGTGQHWYRPTFFLNGGNSGTALSIRGVSCADEECFEVKRCTIYVFALYRDYLSLHAR